MLHDNQVLTQPLTLQTCLRDAGRRRPGRFRLDAGAAVRQDQEVRRRGVQQVQVAGVSLQLPQQLPLKNSGA